MIRLKTVIRHAAVLLLFAFCPVAFADAQQTCLDTIAEAVLSSIANTSQPAEQQATIAKTLTSYLAGCLYGLTTSRPLRILAPPDVITVGAVLGQAWTASSGVHLQDTGMATGSIPGELLAQLAESRIQLYDTVFTDASYLPVIAEPGSVMQLDQYVQSDAAFNWSDINDFHRTQYGQYDNHTYMLPVGADVLMMWYRRDMFAMHSITVPQTWDELLALAVAWNGTDWNGDGIPDYSLCYDGAASCRSTIDMNAIAGAYLQYQGGSQGTYLSPENLSPLTNNPGMAEALRLYAALRKFGDPSQQSICTEVVADFIAGRCLVTLKGNAVMKAANLLPYSKVKGLTAAAPLPGSYLVVDRDSNELMPCNPQQCTSAEYTKLEDGSQVWLNRIWRVRPTFTAGILTSPKFFYQNMSWSFLSFLMSPAIQLAGSLSMMPGVGPMRKTQLSNDSVPDWVAAGFDAQDVEQYLAVARQCYSNNNVVLGLRIPCRDPIKALYDAAANNVTCGNCTASIPQVMSSLTASITAVLDQCPYSYNELLDLYVTALAYMPDGTVELQAVAPALLTIAAIVPVGACLLLVAFVAWRRYTNHGLKVMTGPLTAPQAGPDLTLVVTDIQGSTTLWETLPAEVMDGALKQHHAVVRRLLYKHDGYESATEGDSFIMAFHAPKQALEFALDLQTELLKESWPPELLAQPECAHIYKRPGKRAADSSVRGNLEGSVRSGLRNVMAGGADGSVRVGIRNILVAGEGSVRGGSRSMGSADPSSRGGSRNMLNSGDPFSRSGSRNLPGGDPSNRGTRTTGDVSVRGTKSASSEGSVRGSRMLNAGNQQPNPASPVGPHSVLSPTSVPSPPRNISPTNALSPPSTANSQPGSKTAGQPAITTNSSQWNGDARSTTRSTSATTNNDAIERQVTFTTSMSSSSSGSKSQGGGLMASSRFERAMQHDGGGAGGSSTAFEACMYVDRARAEWMAGAPGDPGAVLAFAGLRVRVGIHTGMDSDSDVKLNQATCRWQYRGQCLAMAKAVSDAGVGGMVLLSDSVFQRLPEDAALHATAILHLGQHRLQDNTHDTHLYIALQDSLRCRLPLFGPIRTTVQRTPSVLTAPVGFLTLVHLHLVGVPILLAWNIGIAMESLSIFEQIAVEELDARGGYLAEYEEGRMLLAFLQPHNAIMWALDCHARMREAAWPPPLLEHELCEELTMPQTDDALDTLEVVVFRGLRMKIGMDVGVVRSEIRQSTGRMRYRGRVAQRSARVLDHASTGQIVCSQLVWTRSSEVPELQEERVAAVSLGVKDLGGERAQLFCCRVSTKRRVTADDDDGSDDDELWSGILHRPAQLQYAGVQELGLHPRRRAFEMLGDREAPPPSGLASFSEPPLASPRRSRGTVAVSKSVGPTRPSMDAGIRRRTLDLPQGESNYLDAIARYAVSLAQAGRLTNMEGDEGASESGERGDRMTLQESGDLDDYRHQMSFMGGGDWRGEGDNGCGGAADEAQLRIHDRSGTRGRALEELEVPQLRVVIRRSTGSGGGSASTPRGRAGLVEEPTSLVSQRVDFFIDGQQDSSDDEMELIAMESRRTTASSNPPPPDVQQGAANNPE